MIEHLLGLGDASGEVEDEVPLADLLRQNQQFADKCFHRCTASRREPVVQPKAGYTLKVFGVVSDHREIINECDRGNHQVHGRHLDATSPQLDSDPSKLSSALPIKVKNGHF